MVSLLFMLLYRKFLLLPVFCGYSCFQVPSILQSCGAGRLHGHGYARITFDDYVMFLLWRLRLDFQMVVLVYVSSESLLVLFGMFGMSWRAAFLTLGLGAMFRLSFCSAYLSNADLWVTAILHLLSTLCGFSFYSSTLLDLGLGLSFYSSTLLPCCLPACWDHCVKAFEDRIDFDAEATSDNPNVLEYVMTFCYYILHLLSLD